MSFTKVNHENKFATTQSASTSAGATTTGVNAVPSISAPFYISLDAKNTNGHYEVVKVTSKTSNSISHAATSYDHTTDEEVRLVVPAVEMDEIATVCDNVQTNLGDGSQAIGMARQAIMNGNFDVWQRGTSVALADVTLAIQADRWQTFLSKDGGTLPTLSSSAQNLTSGDIPGAFNYHRLTTNGAGTSLGVNSYHQFYQRIENGVRGLCGLNKKVTVSFWARSSIANKRICPILAQCYGTGGSPSATEFIKGTPITLTSTWTKYTATFTTNTLVGKTFGTTGDDYLQLNIPIMWGTTFGNTYVKTSVTAETYVGSGTVDIAQVQLCSGDVALPFQPKSYEEELKACQRYYEVGSFYATFGNITTAVEYLYSVFYKVTKRIQPVVSEVNAGVSNFGTTPGVTTTGSNGFYLSRRTSSATATSGWWSSSWAADVEL